MAKARQRLLQTFGGDLQIEFTDQKLTIAITHPVIGLTISAFLPLADAESLADWIKDRAATAEEG